VSNYKYYCSGVATSPAWEILNSATLSLSVNTSSCQFNSTPLYFTSMGDIVNHYGLAGYTMDRQKPRLKSMFLHFSVGLVYRCKILVWVEIGVSIRLV